MSMFKAKKLDIGSFVNTHVIRDHTKRKTYALFEPERYVAPPRLCSFEASSPLPTIRNQTRIAD